MIAVDTNILLYAHRRDSEFHDPATDALGRLADDGQSWAIAWPSLVEFFTVATHSRVYDPPSTTSQAIDQVDAWMESPTLIALGETSSSWRFLRNLLLDARATGPLGYDARIAALCIAHGVRELWTADRDFGRFPALRTRNPLVVAT
jgi:toxin-antitoxin system PIN domain toxin